MDVRKWVKQTAELGYNSVVGGLDVAGAGVGYVTDWVGNLRLFGSTQTSGADQKFDERHYLLIPDKRNEDGYSLAVTRCLPNNVPPINDLPKRRVLHLPCAEAEVMLRSLLIRQAQAEELAKPSEGKTMADRARELADYIDELDGKVFGGVLLIGGLVAVFNPLMGVAIAAKSLIPSLGMLASKYGLRVAEESLNQAEIKSKIKQAEKDVLKQFRGALTVQYVNAVLTIADRALNTSEDEFDPLLQLHQLMQSDFNSEERRMWQLASSAILDAYENEMRSSADAKKANLGQEDLRFFQVLATLSEKNSNKE